VRGFVARAGVLNAAAAAIAPAIMLVLIIVVSPSYYTATFMGCQIGACDAQYG
jgi:hypothetical protein